MIYRCMIWVTILILAGCSPGNYKNLHIEIHAGFGKIELELFVEKAPKTVTAMLSYIDSGFYRDASFFRVLNLNNQPSDAPKAELIQGRLWK